MLPWIAVVRAIPGQFGPFADSPQGRSMGPVRIGQPAHSPFLAWTGDDQDREQLFAGQNRPHRVRQSKSARQPERHVARDTREMEGDA
jgi:hypothetical protein